MDLLEKHLNAKIQEETAKLNDFKKNKRKFQANDTKHLSKEFGNLQNAALKPETEKLSEAQLLRLQQLITTTNNPSQEDNNNKETSASSTAQVSAKSKTSFYETNIDPLWYLTNGPFVIFPRDMIPHLQIQDFVEYFRAYPRLHWSKYPKLKRAIFELLTEQERATLQQYQVHYEQKNRRLNRLYNFVQYSTRIPTSGSQQSEEGGGIFPKLNIWETLNGSENVAADAMNKYYKRNTRALLEDFFELCKLWIIRFVWKGIWMFADIVNVILGR